MTTDPSPRGFAVEIPGGFVGLPTRAPTSQDLSDVARGLEDTFQTGRGDQSASEMAHWFSLIGQLSGAGGMEFAAIGFFHSPVDLERPVYVLVSGKRVIAQTERPEESVAYLQEYFDQQGVSHRQKIQLSVGEALLVTTEQPTEFPVEGHVTNAVLQYDLTAWIPDPAGTTIGVVSVSTSSWRDWNYVYEFALGLFDSAVWEPVDGTSE